MEINISQNPKKVEAKDVENLVNEEEDQYLVDHFEQNGTIAKAKIHYSAQSVLKIPEHYDATNVEFCDCCLYPEKKIGVIDSFNVCDDIKEFSSCGIGTYLYFYFFKYILFCLLLILVMAAIPSAYISNEYSNTLYTFCGDKYTKFDLCMFYNKTNHTFADSLYQLSYQNAYNYKKLAYNISAAMNTTLEGSSSVIYDYNLINFITMMALFINNMFVIMSLGYLVNEVDYGQITPSDFTLMISNVRNNFKDTDDLINNDLEMNGIKPLTVNLTFQLDQYFERKNEINELKKLYTAMKEKNIDRIKVNCHGRIMTKEAVIARMNVLKKEIKTFLEDIDKVETDELFTGVVFATFNTNREYTNYLNQFPKSFFGKLHAKLKYFLAFYLCKCCYSEHSKNILRKKKTFDVTRAPEPQDVIWENLEYSETSRLKRSIKVYSISFLLLCISFGIVLGLNYLQSNQTAIINNQYVKFGLSISISVSISIINNVILYYLNTLSQIEKRTSQSEFYLTLSFKMTIFTFMNSALVPLVSNHINSSLDPKGTILINNIFIIFLSNAIVSPLTWLANIMFLYKKYLMYKLSKKYGDEEPLPMTQFQLNAIFQKPDMNISFKFSYLAKTMLMCLFYLPLVPAGTIISIVGIALVFFVEKFNLVNTYKRPEMLNYTLCMFYIRYYKFFIFVYAIGNWIFLNELYEKNVFAVISLIIFGVFCVFPVHTLLKCDFVAIKEFEILDKEYYDYYFDFLRDYERTNPITRKKGNRNYLEKMKEKGLISEEKFKELALQLNEDNLNVIEAYYKNNSSVVAKRNFNRGKNNNLRNKNTMDNNYKMVYFKNLIGVDFEAETKDENAQKQIAKSNAFLNYAQNITSYYQDPSWSNKGKASQGKKPVWKNYGLKPTIYQNNVNNFNDNSNVPFSSYNPLAENNQKSQQFNPDHMLDIPMAKSLHFNDNNLIVADENIPIMKIDNNVEPSKANENEHKSR